MYEHTIKKKDLTGSETYLEFYNEYDTIYNHEYLMNVLISLQHLIQTSQYIYAYLDIIE